MDFRDDAGQAGHAAFSTSSADLTASRRQLLILDFIPMGSNKTDRVSPRCNEADSWNNNRLASTPSN
jgi:hypothetical protein